MSMRQPNYQNIYYQRGEGGHAQIRTSNYFKILDQHVSIIVSLDRVLCGHIIGLKAHAATPSEAIASTDGTIPLPSRPPDGATMVTLIGTADYLN